MQNRKNPLPTVDIIIEYKKGIILIERKNPPHGWAIPGGFVDYNESLEQAAIREAQEETNLKIRQLRQFHAYSEPGRDARVHTISTVFTATAVGRLEASSDAKAADVFTEQTLPQNIVFDHKKIIEDYYCFKQRKGLPWYK